MNFKIYNDLHSYPRLVASQLLRVLAIHPRSAATRFIFPLILEGSSSKQKYEVLRPHRSGACRH